MNNERTDFRIELEDEYSRLVICSNYSLDSDFYISKKAKEISRPIYLKAHTGVSSKSERGIYMGLTLEQAEEIVKELSRAIDFLRG